MKLLMEKSSTFGDCLCYLPTVAAAVACEEVEHIVLITTPIGQHVFSGLSDKVSLIVLPYRDTLKFGAFRGWKSVWPQLHNRQLDVAVHHHHSATFAYGLAWLLHIPERVGFDFSLARGNFLANRRLPIDLSAHVIELNFIPLRAALCQPELPILRVPPMVADVDRKSVRHRLAGLGLNDNEPFVLIHRGARHTYRQWPYYSELVPVVEKEMGLPVVEAAETKVDTDHRMLSNLQLGELVALTAMATAFVCNNSGPMHLAGALGIPTVVLQGASARNWSFYWRDVPHRTLQVALSCKPCERLDYYPRHCANRARPMACLRDIDVNGVVDALRHIVNERRRAQ